MIVGFKAGGWDSEVATSGAGWDTVYTMKILSKNDYLRNNIDNVAIVYSVDVMNTMTGEEYTVYDGLIAEFHVSEINSITNLDNVMPGEDFMKYHCYRYENNLWKYY